MLDYPDEFHADADPLPADSGSAARVPSPLPSFDDIVARAKELEALARGDATASIMHLWDQGALVRRLIEAPDKYPKNAVGDLAKGLEVTDKLLYQRGDVVVAFPDRARFEALIRGVNAVGVPGRLTIAHVHAVRKLPTLEAREETLRHAARRQISARKLRAEVRATLEHGSKTKNATGRPPPPPNRPTETPESALAQLETIQNEEQLAATLAQLAPEAYRLARHLRAAAMARLPGISEAARELRRVITDELLPALDDCVSLGENAAPAPH